MKLRNTLKTFAELKLIKPVQRALAEERYTTPTPIQAKAIPAALDQRDVLGCAQTGTGKTAAFSLPILNRLGQQNRKATPNRPQVLILSPTRELSLQIRDSLRTYGRHMRVRTALVYGGVSQFHQVRDLNRGAHIVVATPGRLLDLMGQGHIDLSQLQTFVLDEADRMLDMGFLPDLKRIIRELPKKRQSLFFSATLASKIVDLSKDLLTNPVSVNVTPKSRSVETIDQSVLFVDKKAKQSALKTILSTKAAKSVLVFTRTKRTANQLSERLERTGVAATAIHGNKSQNARQRALAAFRHGKVRVLVATDVAARGIDVDGVTHVINFDLPTEPEAYVHRIGRTGRAGASGIALSLCSPKERSELRAIERLIGRKIPVGKQMTEGKENQRELVKQAERLDNEDKSSPKKPSQQRKRRRPGKTRSRSTRTGSNSASANGTQGKRRNQRRRQRVKQTN